MLDDTSTVCGWATHIKLSHAASVYASQVKTWEMVNMYLAEVFGNSYPEFSRGKASSSNGMTNRNAGTITRNQRCERLTTGAIVVAYLSRQYSGLQSLKQPTVWSQAPFRFFPLDTFHPCMRYRITDWIALRSLMASSSRTVGDLSRRDPM